MPETAQLFITCLLDSLYPSTAESVVRVLQRAGARVEVPPGQTCCGQPAFNAGMRGEAAPIAQHTIEVFERTSGPVVVPSGSCATMIRIGYLELFAQEPLWLERAHRLAERTFEFTEYLVDYLDVTDLGARYPGRLTYHASCHLLRELGVDRQPRRLLESVDGAEYVELPYATDCCGFGGVFSVEHPDRPNRRSAGGGLRRGLHHQYPGRPDAPQAPCAGGAHRRPARQRPPHRRRPWPINFARTSTKPWLTHSSKRR